MDLLQVALFTLSVIATACIFFAIGKLVAERSMHKAMQDARQDAVRRSRAVIGGQFSEQLAPYMPGFPYKPTEVKFLGKPIDFLVFEGLDDQHITSVVFVEVKSGNAKMSRTEESLKEAIAAGSVRCEEYRVPRPLTEE